MTIHSKQALLLSDTLIPDIFISDYMAGLSGSALKCYLYLLLSMKNGKAASEKDLAGRLGFPVDETKGALTELTMSGVIEWNDKGKILISDIKKMEIDGYIRLLQKAGSPEPKGIRPEDEKRDNLARSVEKTFFHGAMAYKWYREMDVLWEEFSFAPEVIYNLFHYCGEKKKLVSVKLFHETALIWYGKNIRTIEDVNAYLEKETEIEKILKKVGKKLRRRMTEFDEEYIRYWVEELPYGYDIMEYAIRKMSEFQSTASLKSADSLLKEWSIKKLKDLGEIKTYEAEQAQKNKQRYAREKKRETGFSDGASKQNFEPVVYDESFLQGLEIDLSRYQDDTAI